MLQILMIIILILSILAIYINEKQKEKRLYELDGLRNTISGLKSKLRTAEDKLDDYKVFNKNQREKIGLQAKQIVEQTEKIVELDRRLANAVEGLSVHDVEVMRARANNEYIYTVCHSDGAMTLVNIPMDSKYPDYVAKKKAGLKDKDMKGARAVRWTI